MNEISPTNIYDCQAIIDQIEALAESNEGELTDEQIAELVRANTTSLAQVGKLCGFLKFLDAYLEMGKSEIERIQKLLKTAKNRSESIKRYLTPYVDEQRRKLGRPLDAGKYRVGTRHSIAVKITDPDCFARGGYPNESRRKVTWEPDKTALKEYLEQNKDKGHPGAELVENVTLQIK